MYLPTCKTCSGVYIRLRGGGEGEYGVRMLMFVFLQVTRSSYRSRDRCCDTVSYIESFGFGYIVCAFYGVSP